MRAADASDGRFGPGPRLDHHRDSSRQCVRTCSPHLPTPQEHPSNGDSRPAEESPSPKIFWTTTKDTCLPSFFSPTPVPGFTLGFATRLERGGNHLRDPCMAQQSIAERRM